MATRPLDYSQRGSSSKRHAAERIADLAEEAMTDMGLSEKEKDERAKKFAERADKASCCSRSSK